MDLIEEPGSQWVSRLRRGNRIWLVKENEEAQVEYPYEPPEPGLGTGKLGIFRHNQFFTIQSWWVGLEGQGIDGSQLIRAIEGHLPENPEPLPEPLVRQLVRQVDALQHRVETLEAERQFIGLLMGL